MKALYHGVSGWGDERLLLNIISHPLFIYEPCYQLILVWMPLPIPWLSLPLILFDTMMSKFFNTYSDLLPIFLQRNHVPRKQELKPSVQELASRAASRSMVEAAKNIIAPTTAYQFEVCWRGFSGDRGLQASLLKVCDIDRLSCHWCCVHLAIQDNINIWYLPV